MPLLPSSRQLLGLSPISRGQHGAERGLQVRAAQSRYTTAPGLLLPFCVTDSTPEGTSWVPATPGRGRKGRWLSSLPGENRLVNTHGPARAQAHLEAGLRRGDSTERAQSPSVSEVTRWTFRTPFGPNAPKVPDSPRSGGSSLQPKPWPPGTPPAAP